MTDQKPTELSTLGRPFNLGMLYDLRSDMLIPGITLWDSKILKDNLTEVPKIETRYEILTEDSIQEKAHALGIEGSVKLSLLGGLIDVSGSAKYAQDAKTTHRVSRLTLKYYTTTKFQQLTMEHLGKGKLNHTDLFDVNIATHVVTGILYGAEAFFIFERKMSGQENKKDIEGSLHSIIKKIPSCAIEANIKIGFNHEEKYLMNSLNCKFYGDFQLKSNPNTFEEAVKLYGQLPNLIGESRENVVPKRVWLYPLHLLDGKNMKMVREISSNLIDHAINFFDQLHALEIRATDLKKNENLTYFNYMEKHLDEFTARLSEFERHLKKQIISLLPEIRGGGKEENALHDVFKKLDLSPFNMKKLISWIEDKEKEINLIGQFIKILTIQSNITVNTSSLDNIIGDLDCHCIVCLSFRLIDADEPQLIDMFHYLQDSSISNSRQASQPWFKVSDIISKIRTRLRQFIDFARANRMENKHIKFIANEEHPVNGIKEVLLTLYKDGVPCHGFIIPSKPSKPYATLITSIGITLEWTDAENGSEKVESYTVMYRQCHDDKDTRAREDVEEKWNEISTPNNTKEMYISNLKPKTAYEFRVHSKTEVGFGPISETSERIKTDSFLISNLLVNGRWEQNGITIAGGNGMGENDNQLHWSHGLFVDDDDDQTIFVADQFNHRIVQYKKGSTNGQVVAGGHGIGNRSDQLNYPKDVLIDKETNSLIISDRDNRRVVCWSRHNGTTQGETLIDNVKCFGLAMDQQRNLYVSNAEDSEVRRYEIDRGNNTGTLVAGGNGRGSDLNQLNWPTYLFIGKNQSLYVSDHRNHRVMKWDKGAKQGIVVAGGQGPGCSLTQLSLPMGIFVDTSNTLYVAEEENHRITRWCQESKQGVVLVGGNGRGNGADQLNNPRDLSFDKHGNLYVVDNGNNRVQRFNIIK